MSKLVILSERNVLDFLKSQGVQPYEFYTDVTTFKKHMAMFEDVKVLCLFTGTCYFSKKIVGELINTMEERAKDAEDTGIAEVITLSDTILPLCLDYYKYEDIPIECVRYSKRDKISPLEEVNNIWDIIEYEKTPQINGVYLQEDLDENLLKVLKEKNLSSDIGANKVTVPKIEIFKTEQSENTEKENETVL